MVYLQIRFLKLYTIPTSEHSIEGESPSGVALRLNTIPIGVSHKSVAE